VGGPGGTGTTPGTQVDAHRPAVVVPVHHQHRGRHIQRLPVRPPVAHPRLLEGPLGARIVMAADSQLGWPYVWGGESERQGGFDCSGLVDYAYAAAGHALPGRPTAEVLWLMSTPIRRSALMPGDLLFLLDNDNYAYHVAIYAGHGRVVVAAHRGTDVAIVPLASVPWSAFGRLFHPHAERMPAHFRDVAGSRVGAPTAISRRPLVHRRNGITVLTAAVALHRRHRRQTPPKRSPQRTTPAVVVRDEPLAQPAMPRQRPAAG
jgi:hypothetical protein